MSRSSCLKLTILALCAACGGSPATDQAAEMLADPVDAQTPLQFSGQVFLGGALAHDSHGSIVVSVRFPGSPTPVLQRSYEITDPWRTRNSIQFGLSSADKVVDPLPVFARNMVLVARFDADGNPLTRGPTDVQAMIPAPTGASDLAIELRRGDPDAPQAAAFDDK